MPIKERRTKILLALFLLTDVSFSPVNFDERLQRIFDLSFNQKTKGAISVMIKEGLIEKSEIRNPKSETNTNTNIQNSDIQNVSNFEIRASNFNQYRLTEKGYRLLCLEFPFFRFLKEEWDGRWRIISYEIPERKREIRDRLRREMRGWGLGPWHRSFWLTPHPIIENLRNLVYGREEEKYVQAFEATHVFGDLNLLVEKVWQKSELDKKYRELFKKWHSILSGQKNNETKMKEVVASYVELLRLDPGLPQSLIGKRWIGFEAFSIFKEVRSILLR